MAPGGIQKEVAKELGTPETKEGKRPRKQKEGKLGHKIKKGGKKGKRNVLNAVGNLEPDFGVTQLYDEKKRGKDSGRVTGV